MRLEGEVEEDWGERRGRASYDGMGREVGRGVGRLRRKVGQGAGREGKSVEGGGRGEGRQLGIECRGGEGGATVKSNCSSCQCGCVDEGGPGLRTCAGWGRFRGNQNDECAGRNDGAEKGLGWAFP